ncbi:MAG: Eco57I restriction-modification methylase domain-containing protein [Gemmatimonadaceae bacterium]
MRSLSMKGFVPTPPDLVDLMVGKLFGVRPPTSSTTLLDPGCGEGEFIAGVLRWCAANGRAVPRIVGVEQHAGRATIARRRFASCKSVEIKTADFLTRSDQSFDLIIGNPPYVSLGHLSVSERELYRARFETARGRFDLYMLFFEQALRLLRPSGRLVFVTPEKFTYVDAASGLRQLLLKRTVEELHYLDEATFQGFVTYPIITTVGPHRRGASTAVIHRSDPPSLVELRDTRSWQPIVRGVPFTAARATLADVCVRVSCGIATGADAAFVVLDSDIARDLRDFAHPTISGRQLSRTGTLVTQSRILIPYDRGGRLLPESRLGALGRYLRAPARKSLLAARTCAARKPWYSYHDNAPLDEILRPKLLCKDISQTPFFVADERGEIVPRHSTYYIVPKDPAQLPMLLDYLNSKEAAAWLTAHCQRAANGYVRLQSGVLKRLPLPDSLASADRTARQLEIEEIPAFA